MADLMDRITVNPEQCGGRPCVRGMRIRVVDVLDLFAAGLSKEQILEEMPDLQLEDLTACLQYARRRVYQAVLATGRSGWTLNFRPRWLHGWPATSLFRHLPCVT